VGELRQDPRYSRLPKVTLTIVVDYTICVLSHDWMEWSSSS
jgi:hypothetical protein